MAKVRFIEKLEKFFKHKAAPIEGDGAATKAPASVAQLQGLIGIISVGIGNIAAIVTHVDTIRKFVSAHLGPEWLFRLHNVLLFGASVLLLVGYLCLSYWLYLNFVRRRSKLTQSAFSLLALVVVSVTVTGSYYFFREVEVRPIVEEQTIGDVQNVLSQQTFKEGAEGGFRFSQSGTSNDVQGWTTAQCLAAILQRKENLTKDMGPALHQAFDYLERERLTNPDDGWPYMQGIKWGVTEIDAWVALAYLYSLRDEVSVAVWKAEELPQVRERTRSVLKLLLKRQHDDGSWSIIEKTDDPRHVRMYSTIMAMWALSTAEKNGDIVSGHEAEYGGAVVLGAKWLLTAHASNADLGFSGWWPNPSVGGGVGEHPGLTAHVLFVLGQAKVTHAFIGADSRYKEAVEAFLKAATEGGDNFESLIKRKIGQNEQAHDSDRYLPGRTETAEQSTFLWYPWTIILSTALQNDSGLKDYQRDQFRKLTYALFRRIDEEIKFERSNEVIYPTAEFLLAEGYYLQSISKSLAPK
ncbi:hypothetical protein UP09_10700 [Bradyrhizobium sp. LTSP885]|uniref:hypothetical protein n=1 Tax=Bradyrhizobium sp. LTSP885 TaxID=1619232 RepID=UPI0005C80222|nr:hypothetical protein [Bradyrhizobium sp. LTSP885]KJC47098.1 hypothetical protein UP09_10700 [Bradyrhizobium sp. LTSP885]